MQRSNDSAPAPGQDSAAPRGRAPIDEQQAVRDEVRATLGALMPWGVSILAHVALIALAFLLVWQTIEQAPHPPAPVTLTPTPEVVTRTTSDLVLDSAPKAGGPPVVPIHTQPVQAPKPPAPGVGRPELMIPELVKPGRGDRDGLDEGEGPGGGTIIGPPIPPYVRDVAFVIDASGSMIDVLPFVVNELKRLVHDLDRAKRVTILFFSGQGVFEAPGGDRARGLRALTPAYKQAITEWVSLDKHRFEAGGRGGAHVQAAITRALGYKPQRVYLLSDNLTGGGAGATRHELMQDELVAAIHAANTARPPAKIHTIQFLYEDPLARAGLTGTLDRIATETGGTYTFIHQLGLTTR